MEKCTGITLSGTQPFMGKEIPVVLGGFGPDKRCMSDKTVAEIHGMRTPDVRRRITDNISRFRKDVDCIDLLITVRQTHDATICSQLGYTSAEIAKAEHIYILSERGYSKLIKIMDTDLAWEIHDKLMDEYFELRDAHHATPPERLARAKAMLINAKRRAAQDYRKLYEAAGVKPEYQIMALQDYMGADGPTLPASALAPVKVTYDKGTIAKRLGVYSKTGLPHAQAVGAIIGKLGVTQEDMERVPFSRNGHDGFDVQYTDRVAVKAAQWLEKQGYPATITGGGKTYHVSYKGREVAS